MIRNVSSSYSSCRFKYYLELITLKMTHACSASDWQLNVCGTAFLKHLTLKHLTQWNLLGSSLDGDP